MLTDNDNGEVDVDASGEARPRWYREGPTLAGLVGLVIVVVGLIVGLGPLNDNSFMTHLATGRIIVDTHHIPHSDPYTYTALGEPWVVQSWLASLMYGVADYVFGPAGVVLLVGLSAAVLAGLLWTLTRPARSVLMRVLILGILVVLGTDFWIERPLLFGLIALSLALLSAEGRLDPRWLIPVFWVWVNTHGSFPLGLVALALLAAGRHFDGERPIAELAALKWAAIGTVIGGVLNPLGPRLLLFPIELLSRQSALQNVIEWQAPTFLRISQKAFLLEIVLVVIALARRPSWRLALPAVVFLPAALIGSRNMIIAALVLVPPLASSLRDIGDITGEERKPVYRIAGALVIVLGLLFVVTRTQGDVYLLDDYPVAAVAWAERTGNLTNDTNVVTRDYGGNYLELRNGGRYRPFIDDRYDMFPQSVVDDYDVLLSGKPGWDAVLRDREADLVIWPVDSSLAQLLLASPDWNVVYTDSQWIAAKPK